MKVLVLGSGVIGVCSAYYLAEKGYEVTVIDRRQGPALETSYANAGEISPGYAAPWASPGMPIKAIKWLFMEHSPMIIQPSLHWQRWRWLARFIGNCTLTRYKTNKERMLRLAQYSLDSLRELRIAAELIYDQQSLGTMQLFRTQEQLDNAARDMNILWEYDVPFELLDQQGIIQHEPALGEVQEKYSGALYLPEDETGDCFKFTELLEQKAKTLGVEFQYGTNITEILNTDDTVKSVQTDNGELSADAFVVALGSYSPLLLKPLGIHLPVCPVKGYSMTIPVTHAKFAPKSTIMDETFKVAITRLGNRIRLGGTAEITGFNLSTPEHRIQMLKHVAMDLFPKGGDMSKASFWAGLRPMTPDGTPVLGETPYNNLYLNTGHGTLGWTMAAGSGRLIADLISGTSPEIDMNGLTLDRYN